MNRPLFISDKRVRKRGHSLVLLNELSFAFIFHERILKDQVHRKQNCGTCQSLQFYFCTKPKVLQRLCKGEKGENGGVQSVLASVLLMPRPKQKKCSVSCSGTPAAIEHTTVLIMVLQQQKHFSKSKYTFKMVSDVNMVKV